MQIELFYVYFTWPCWYHTQLPKYKYTLVNRPAIILLASMKKSRSLLKSLCYIQIQSTVGHLVSNAKQQTAAACLRIICILPHPLSSPGVPATSVRLLSLHSHPAAVWSSRNLQVTQRRVLVASRAMINIIPLGRCTQANLIWVQYARWPACQL